MPRYGGFTPGLSGGYPTSVAPPGTRGQQQFGGTSVAQQQIAGTAGRDAISGTATTSTGSGSLDAREQMVAALAMFDLDVPSLITWIDQLVQQGYTSIPITQLYERQEFRDRFPVIEQRRQRGLSPLSPAEIIQWEANAQSVIVRFGLPDFMTDRMFLQSKLAAGWSIAELSDRLEEGWNRVATAPVEVRSWFAAQYGAAGDAALATWFLDPNRAMPELERAARAAEIGGTGLRFSFDVTAQMAHRLADIGVNAEQAATGFRDLAQMRSLFAETVSEDEDLSELEEGVDLVYGLSGEGARKVRQRLEERVAGGSGGGGTSITERGTGAGRAY